jgi:pyruvate kinase
MMQNGMNVARLNFSHGSHRDHAEKIRTIRDVSARLGIPVAIIQDLGGPKIRVGDILDPGIRLIPGQTFVLTSQEVEGTEERVSVSYPNLPQEVKVGDRLLLADGLMELVVKETNATDIFCEVITGGTLTSRKGINLPDGTISVPALTPKDREDLIFGLKHNVDYVALSFVRSAEDLHVVKELIRAHDKDTPVIAKIEKHEAVEHMDEIVEAADAIMVARGDLGVEVPLEDVPFIQKRLIKQANAFGKPVITATQMLRSMVDSPRPTRAEATDVANAVLDGTDAVMLSEETASGNYPVEAVEFMHRIAENAEKHFFYDSFLQPGIHTSISESVAQASCMLANNLEAVAIVAPTQSGQTAGYISRFRPRQPIIALSPNPKTVRRLTLLWGCIPRLVPRPQDTDDMFEVAARGVHESGMGIHGDLVVITAGHPLWVTGTTTMLQVKKL